MTEQQHILKQRLKELIGDRKVVAALFYTFNFDPQFFENYVMPLLVPGHTFINNTIANNILWRKLYKDNLVPPITVYFDQDAKSTDNGPFLDYQLISVNMPMLGRKKGNFHPKNSFILVQNPDDRSIELIIITGSNNITQNGWCENVECISEQIIIAGKEFPYAFRGDIKKFMADIHSDFGLSAYTEPERLIDGYLNKISYTNDRQIFFYNSYNYPFQQFLDEYVLTDESISLAEIISPFFKRTPELISVFRDRKIEVKVQAPVKDGFCLLDKDVYEAYKKTGSKWYLPPDIQRNNHSKVYRFYGDERTYTIIGSVNLTDPAWNGYAGRAKKVYNIESAILYSEKVEKPVCLLKKELKDDQIKFIESPLTLENWNERIEIPDIWFSVNWINKELSWKSKAKNICHLELSASVIIPLNRSGTIKLSDLKNGKAIIDSISRKPVLKVLEEKGNEKVIHFYYTNQSGFEARPLQFRLSATDILDAWDLLGVENEDIQEWLAGRLEAATDKLQDESGKLLSDNTQNKSLLNEMARHFYGLVTLEKFLFDERVYKKKNSLQALHVNNLKYYLTYDNADTLYSYFKDLIKLRENDNMMSVYYWIILTVMQSNFYSNKELFQMLRGLYSENVSIQEFRSAVKLVQSEIQEELDKTETALAIDKKKINWAKSLLENTHGIS